MVNPKQYVNRKIQDLCHIYLIKIHQKNYKQIMLYAKVSKSSYFIYKILYKTLQATTVCKNIDHSKYRKEY